MSASKMKAVVCTKYGSPDYLQLQEVAKPIPQSDEILVKIYATPVTAADTFMRKGTPFFSRLFLGFFRPKNPITGTGFAGKVEAVGTAVKKFKTGDEVFGETTLNFSANAEYVCVPEYGVIMKKPPKISFEEAAPICDGALTSYNFLREIAKVKEGQKVLINGASGALGTAAVQLAGYFGAEVTGVCSAKNMELVRKLGADHVIDYETTDFTKAGKQYDIIYDTIGKSSFSACKNILTKDGIYLSPVLGIPLLLQMLWTSLSGTKKAKFAATGLKPVSELRALLADLKELFETGQLITLVDQSFSLEQAVEAHQYVDTGRKKGNVVLIP